MERKQRRLLMVLAMALVVGMATSAADAVRLAYWKLDETAGTIAYDEEGIAGFTDCILYGNAEWAFGVVPEKLLGISTGSIRLDGSGDYLSCGATSMLDLKGDPFTISIWIRGAQSTITNNSTPIERGGQWRIGIYGSPRTIEFLTYSPGYTYTTGFTDVSDQAWHHLAAVYNGADAITYIDGVEQDRNTIGGNYVSGDGTFRIGGPVISWGQYFDGWIDDVAIFNEALSQLEIQSVMLKGAGWFVGGNGPPFVDAGPYYQVVIKEQTGPTIHQLDGFTADKTVFEPNKLEQWWFNISGPSTLSFTPDANDVNATIDFTAAAVGEYRLGLHVTDGELDANDYMIIDLKPSWWTGLTVWWAFEDDLVDKLDPINQGVVQNNLAKASSTCLDPYFGPGIVGQAAYVGHNDGAGHFATLETQDSADLELERAFTIECYVKPRFYNPLVDDRAQILSKWYIEDPATYDWHMSYNCYLANNEYMTITIVNPRSTSTPPTVYYTGGLDTTLAHQMFPAFSEWQHLAWVSDGTRKVDFWIDGVLRDSYTFPIEEEYFEIKDTIAPMRIADGIMYDYRVYEGWLDEIMFWKYNKPASYLKSRARLIPLQAPEPTDQEINCKTSAILSWSQAKGYDNPLYDVYFARDGSPLVKVAENLAPQVLEEGEDPVCFFDPFEEGGAPALLNNQKYNWRVDAVNVPGAPITGPEWTFTTMAADYTGLIAQWKFNEGDGTVAHDSALPDDVGYYHYPSAGEKLPPEWLPGWINTEIGLTSLSFRNFEYLDIDAADPNVFHYLPDTDFSIATWMMTMPKFMNQSEELVGKGFSYGVSQQGTNQNLEFYFNDVFSGDTLGGSKAVGDGIWHHVVAVYIKPTRSTDGVGYLYVDGVLDASEEVIGNYIRDEQNPLSLAKNMYEAYDFNGALEETRIYRRSLSAAEAWQLYDEGIKNLQPVIYAGVNTVIPYPQTAISYKTTIRDDNKPTGKSPQITWTQISGSGTMTFDPEFIEQDEFPGGFVPDADNVLTTQITFSEPGFYKARLKADDLTYNNYDEVRFWVQSEVKEPGMERAVAYWRFEEDTPETNWRGIPGADDPNTLVIANEVALAPPLIADHIQTYNVPGLHPTVGMATVPLTGAPNTKHLGEGVGDFTWYGERKGTTGMSIEMEAEAWDGLLFCEDGITVECWIKLDEVNWTVFDMEENPAGLSIFNTQTGNTNNWSGVGTWDGVYRPTNTLKFEFWLETEIPNQYNYECLVTDILISEMGWKNIAFTYEKETGIARVYENGIPAWITHYFNENASDIDFYEYNPMVEYWQGEPGRTFVMPENLNLVIASGVDTIPSGFDELRITAEPLFPPQLLIAGPGVCEEKVQGDMDGDCDVDVVDLKLFCDSWLTCNNADPTECFKN